jgi:hypothetical protein
MRFQGVRRGVLRFQTWNRAEAVSAVRVMRRYGKYMELLKAFRLALGKHG